jgi:hypothetical protein
MFTSTVGNDRLIDWACRREYPRRATLDRLTAVSPHFTAMRKLAMNFRAILFGPDPAGPH